MAVHHKEAVQHSLLWHKYTHTFVTRAGSCADPLIMCCSALERLGSATFGTTARMKPPPLARYSIHLDAASSPKKKQMPMMGSKPSFAAADTASEASAALDGYTRIDVFDGD
jgi:hypothetical protein